MQTSDSRHLHLPSGPKLQASAIYAIHQHSTGLNQKAIACLEIVGFRPTLRHLDFRSRQSLLRAAADLLRDRNDPARFDGLVE